MCELKQCKIVHMSKEKTKQISVRFPLDLYEQIDHLAREGDRSYNAQVIRLLRERLQQQDKKSKEGHK